jgi:hypothetical protein
VAKSICSVEGCGRPLRCRGWCMTHYDRWYRTGDPQVDVPVVVRRQTCTVPGCGRKHDGVGFCAGHRRRLKKYGDVLADLPVESRRPFGMTSEEVFRHYMIGDPPIMGCWEWSGPQRATRSGYGVISLHPSVLAHRFAYELFHGPIPDGLLVRHRCDNPPCVHPDHLLVGTNADNVRDMWERGRARPGGSSAHLAN